MPIKKVKKGKAEPKSRSPFSSELVRIVVDDAILTVHKSFVQDKHKLFDRYEEVESVIPLRRFSVHVGHVLVHWLYKGTYELLERETAPTSREALQTAFAVYSLSRENDLPELEMLARDQISALGDQDSIFTLIDVVEEVYPRTIGRDEWLAGYMTSRLKAAIKENPELAMLPGRERENDGISVSRIIVKSVMEAYRELKGEEKGLGLAESQDAIPPQAEEERAVEKNDNSDYDLAPEDLPSAEIASPSVEIVSPSAELDACVTTVPETTPPPALCDSLVPEIHKEAEIDVNEPEPSFPLKRRRCKVCKKTFTARRQLCKKCKTTAPANTAPEPAPENPVTSEMTAEASWADLVQEPSQISPVEEVAVVVDEGGEGSMGILGREKVSQAEPLVTV